VRASIRENDIASPGSFLVTVFNPPPGGGSSNPRSFEVTPPPTFTISGLPEQAASLDQLSLSVTLAEPAGSPLSGTVTLTFTPDASVPVDDPAIQFSRGGRVAGFSVATGMTRADFDGGGNTLGVQTGTVSGTISITVVLNGSAVATHHLTIPRHAPRISRVEVQSRTPSGFELVIVGYSSIRSVDQANFRFTPRPGSNVSSTLLQIDVQTEFQNWYRSTASQPYGSQFRLVVPFSVNGDASVLESVSVSLTSSSGNSTEVTAPI
jgi:hypothetical protein